MTPKQEERMRTKIKKIKATFAAEKRRWGWYDETCLKPLVSLNPESESTDKFFLAQ